MLSARNVLRAGAPRAIEPVVSPGAARMPGGPSAWPGWAASATLPPLAALPTAPGCARTFAAATVSVWEMPELIDSVQLVVSELVANAVTASLHAGPGGEAGVISIRLLTDHARVVIEVWDQAAGTPVIREAADELGESGRGLMLVDAISAQWGWRPLLERSGKCVWAVLTRPQPTVT
jgi:anti-sigma regulatory factor (Ser/Thr protein kinase)